MQEDVQHLPSLSKLLSSECWERSASSLSMFMESVDWSLSLRDLPASWGPSGRQSSSTWGQRSIILKIRWVEQVVCLALVLVPNGFWNDRSVN